MAVVKSPHQFGGDARVPFSFGGSGEGRVRIVSSWAADELTVNSYQAIWKAAKNCYISNFTIRSDDMDSHGTPTLEWAVGTTAGTGVEVYTGSGTTIGEAGGYDLTNATDESTEAGFYLAADGVLYLNVLTAAATGAAGDVEIAFDVAYV